MSDFLEIKHNLKQVTRSLKQMDKAVRQAYLASINRATQRTKTETGRKTRERYVVKQREVVETIRIRKASGNSLQATLTSRGHAIPLIKFGTTPKRRPQRPPKAVKAAVYRGGAKKPIEGAFVTDVGHHTGVFERVGKKRLPIRELYGPSVPSMVNSEDVREHARAVYNEEMRKRLPHELDRTLGRLKT